MDMLLIVLCITWLIPRTAMLACVDNIRRCFPALFASAGKPVDGDRCAGTVPAAEGF